jgi:hypothetical protein
MNEQEALQACYARVFNTSDGEAVLRDIEARTCARETSFSPDALRMAFNEGRRSVALHLRAMLRKAADAPRPASGCQERAGRG